MARRDRPSVWASFREGFEETRRPGGTGNGERKARPSSPWAPFPLIELTVLVGIVMIVWGFVSGSTRGWILVGGGVTLGIIAGLDTSIREHFAGYRSHASLLAGFAAVVVLGVGFFALADEPWGWVVSFGTGSAVFVTLFIWLTSRFAKRAAKTQPDDGEK